tara:strand:+ start:1640 stop:1894 length:255 start_codon:yes stop_codon:yes gene_type:complete
MTKEERVKKILMNPKGYQLKDGYPEEVQVAVKSFLEATKMVMTENLDHIPHEYLTNMMEVLIKYPETQKVAWELVQILKKDGVI